MCHDWFEVHSSLPSQTTLTINLVHQDEKSRRRRKKAERSHKDSSSESSADSEDDEAVSLVPVCCNLLLTANMSVALLIK